MRKAILSIAAIAAIASLTSCGNDEFNVKLRNGSIVKAKDEKNRGYKVGDTVCVNDPVFLSQPWEITSNGVMRDTMTYYEYKRPDGSVAGVLNEYRIGTIVASK